jgi:hypothetical protein
VCTVSLTKIRSKLPPVKELIVVDLNTLRDVGKDLRVTISFEDEFIWMQSHLKIQAGCGAILKYA